MVATSKDKIVLKMRLFAPLLHAHALVAATCTAAAAGTGGSGSTLRSHEEGSRRLRWYIGNVPRVQDFLLGGPASNAHNWLNTSLDLGAPVTDGVYQCCHGVDIQANGTLKGFPFNASRAPWNVTAFAQANISMYYTITPGAKDTGAVTKAALARADAFAQELLNLTLAYGLAGVHTDWEYPSDNDLPSWIALWARVKTTLSAHGKQIVMSVDDSAPGKESVKDKSWSYLSHWDMFVNISDVLVNMGGYPLSNHHESFPAAEKLRPYRCGNAGRWCGTCSVCTAHMQHLHRYLSVNSTAKVTQMIMWIPSRYRRHGRGHASTRGRPCVPTAARYLPGRLRQRHHYIRRVDAARVGRVIIENTC